MYDEVAAHLAKLTDVVSSASDGLEMDLQSILELFRNAEQGLNVYRQPKDVRNAIFHA